MVNHGFTTLTLRYSIHSPLHSGGSEIAGIVMIKISGVSNYVIAKRIEILKY